MGCNTIRKSNSNYQEEIFEFVLNVHKLRLNLNLYSCVFARKKTLLLQYNGHVAHSSY